MKVIGAETTAINRVAVIGAGAMGGGIAAQFANAGIAVELLDIAGGDNGTRPAEAGIARQLKVGGFMVPEAAGLVRPGNIDDHLDRLSDADWIIEVVVEQLDVKQALFARIAPFVNPSAIVSSNTSTIRRADLVACMDSNLARRFAITHFFNPPRLMPLLEIVTGREADPDLRDRLLLAAKVLLGKTPIDCNDTPGFIANRIGCFWLAVSVNEAVRLGIDIETADAVQTVLGVPKTGVFGLLDLIGIDLVPTIWGSLMQSLPSDDALRAYDLPGNALIVDLLAKGSLGRKSGAGCYRKSADGQFEVFDAGSFTYRPRRAAQEFPVALPDLLAGGGPIGDYARSVFRQLVDYCATHLGEIAADVGVVDQAMQLGYSWRAGPFALADKAADFFRAQSALPAVLTQGLNEGFYRDGKALCIDGRRVTENGQGLVGRTPVIVANEAASLHDLGDGIACLRLHTKMNALTVEVFDLLEQALDRAGADYRALVIANDDERAFSAGADLSFFARLIGEVDGEAAIDSFIARGQALFLRLRYLPVPVVAAVHGFALGGGCELQMHAGSAVAHAEATIGLPEAGVGLVPGWGGCTRLWARLQESRLAMPDRLNSFMDVIFNVRLSGSAQEAKKLALLRPDDGIVMHRAWLVQAARQKAVELGGSYVAPAPVSLTLADAAISQSVLAAYAERRDRGALSQADYAIAQSLICTVSATDSESVLDEAAMMRRERVALLALSQTAATRARIEHILATGKRLNN